MGRWVDEWMDIWTVGWVDGRMDERVNLTLNFTISCNIFFLDLDFEIDTNKYIVKQIISRKPTNSFISLGMGNYFAFAILCRKMVLFFLYSLEN